MKIVKSITLPTGVTVNHNEDGKLTVETDTYLNCLKKGNKMLKSLVGQII